MAEKENLLGKFKKGASRARKKAEDSLEQSRIRSKLRELAHENEKLYRQIGEGVYRSAEDTLSRQSFVSFIRQIEANYEEQKALYYKAALLSNGAAGMEKSAKQFVELTGQFPSELGGEASVPEEDDEDDEVADDSAEPSDGDIEDIEM